MYFFEGRMALQGISTSLCPQLPPAAPENLPWTPFWMDPGSRGSKCELCATRWASAWGLEGLYDVVRAPVEGCSGLMTVFEGGSGLLSSRR